MADPIGYVVAAQSPDGRWSMDSLGMWSTKAEAEEERGDVERADMAVNLGDADSYFVCAVIPLEAHGG